MEKFIKDKEYATLEEIAYLWKFLKGVLNNQYCEIGIICNGKEVEAKEYTRQLCLLEIKEKKRRYVLRNSSRISFPESDLSWGHLDYIIASCNGSNIWIPNSMYLYPWTTCYFEPGKFFMEFPKESLKEIEAHALSYELYKKKEIDWWNRFKW